MRMRGPECPRRNDTKVPRHAMQRNVSPAVALLTDYNFRHQTPSDCTHTDDNDHDGDDGGGGGGGGDDGGGLLGTL